MKKEYQKHIISTDKHQVWLHRTSKDLIDKIMKEGLLFLDLTGTASLQPYDAKGAEASYQTNFGTRQAVAIIKIPQELARKYYFKGDTKGLRHEGYTADKEISYWHPTGKYAIQRQHIPGWIDKETEEYHPNPYLNEPQKLTSKHFPPTMYGGLEKDLVQQEKPAKNKKTKIPKFKAGKLPPPPSSIVLLP